MSQRSSSNSATHPVLASASAELKTEQLCPVSIIGEGAYGVVMSGTSPNGRVAIKAIKNLFDHPVITLRTLREIQLLRLLKHENVLELTDVLIGNAATASSKNYNNNNQPLIDSGFSTLYVITGLMDSDLSHVLSHQELSLEHIRFFAYQLLRGVQHLHAVGVIHRDLKPRNLFVNENCDLRIGDLGMARPIQFSKFEKNSYNKSFNSSGNNNTNTNSANQNGKCSTLNNSRCFTATTTATSVKSQMDDASKTILSGHNYPQSDTTNATNSTNNSRASNSSSSSSSSSSTSSNNDHRAHQSNIQNANAYPSVHHNSINNNNVNNNKSNANNNGRSALPTVTDMTRYVATRWYRAPELLLFSSSYGPPVDLWAVGCIIAEMFLKSALFRGQSTADQLAKICSVFGGLNESNLNALGASENAKKSVAKLGLLKTQPTCPQHIKSMMIIERSGGFIPCEEHARKIRFHQILESSDSLKSFITEQVSLRTILVKSKVPSQAIDLIENLMKINPNERLTADEALKHSFFKDLFALDHKILKQQKLIHLHIDGGSGSSSSAVNIQEVKDLLLAEAMLCAEQKQKVGCRDLLKSLTNDVKAFKDIYSHQKDKHHFFEFCNSSSNHHQQMKFFLQNHQNSSKSPSRNQNNNINNNNINNNINNNNNIVNNNNVYNQMSNQNSNYQVSQPYSRTSSNNNNQYANQIKNTDRESCQNSSNKQRSKQQQYEQMLPIHPIDYQQYEKLYYIQQHNNNNNQSNILNNNNQINNTQVHVIDNVACPAYQSDEFFRKHHNKCSSNNSNNGVMERSKSNNNSNNNVSRNSSNNNNNNNYNYNNSNNAVKQPYTNIYDICEAVVIQAPYKSISDRGGPKMSPANHASQFAHQKQFHFTEGNNNNNNNSHYQ